MTPIRLQCPACLAPLRLKAVPNTGSSIRCPRCQHKFPAPAMTNHVGSVLQDPLSKGTFSSQRSTTRPAASPPPLLWIGLGVVGVLVLMVFAAVAVWVLAPVAGQQTASQSMGTGQAKRRSGGPTQADVHGASLPPFADVNAATPKSKPTLFYRWGEMGGFKCYFEVSANLGEKTRVISGLTTYRNTNISPARFQPQDTEKPTRGSGTAFVVHPDGVLVTCAHVIKNATAISVVMDGRPFPAKVIASDVRNDIALLRVSATKLPCLPLADSEQIQLAEEVRTFGFPLTTLLGESIKISRGEISGIVQQTGRKLIQVDATVNPGNSGGPVVDARGRVVGIASALIAGDDIAAIGFAVPSNVAISLLKQHGIGLPQAEMRNPLSGPEVARKVTPSVMLVKVEFGGGSTAGQQHVVEYTGVFKSEVEVRGLRMPSLNRTHGRGKLLVDQFGRISHSVGDTDLPMLLGQLGHFGIEPLSEDGSSTWQESQVAAIVNVISAPSAAPRYRSPLERLYGRSPFGLGGSSQQKIEMQPIVEQIDYEVIKETSNTVEIKKTYHLKTMQEEGEPTRLDVTGSGTLVFDKAIGMPRSLNYQGTFTIADNGQSLRIPITVVCQYKTLEEAETARAARPPVRKITTPNAPRNTAPISRAPASGKQSGGLDKFDPTK